MNGDKDVPVQVYHEGAPVPTALGAVADVFAQARAAGLGANVVTFALTPESKKILAKRRHDIKAALRTLGFTVKALESGYKFQDDKAAAKIDAIAKAILVLEKEGDVLTRVLHTE